MHYSSKEGSIISFWFLQTKLKSSLKFNSDHYPHLLLISSLVASEVRWLPIPLSRSPSRWLHRWVPAASMRLQSPTSWSGSVLTPSQPSPCPIVAPALNYPAPDWRWLDRLFWSNSTLTHTVASTNHRRPQPQHDGFSWAPPPTGDLSSPTARGRRARKFPRVPKATPLCPSKPLCCPLPNGKLPHLHLPGRYPVYTRLGPTFWALTLPFCIRPIIKYVASLSPQGSSKGLTFFNPWWLIQLATSHLIN